MESIFAADDDSTVSAEKKTKREFYAFRENSFAVLQDQETIIGIEGQSKSIIVKNIANEEAAVEEFGQKNSPIYTIQYVKEHQTLLIGHLDGTVIQYSKAEASGKWEEQKNYGNLDIGEIFSCVVIENLIVFGGYGTGKIRIIDLVEQMIFSVPLHTDVKYIYSMVFCRHVNEKFYLSLAGSSPGKPNKQHSFLDITQLVLKFRFSPPRSNRNKQTMDNESYKSNSENENKSISSQNSKNETIICLNREIEILISKLSKFLKEEKIFEEKTMKKFDKKFDSKKSTENKTKKKERLKFKAACQNAVKLYKMNSFEKDLIDKKLKKNDEKKCFDKDSKYTQENSNLNLNSCKEKSKKNLSKSMIDIEKSLKQRKKTRWKKAKKKFEMNLSDFILSES